MRDWGAIADLKGGETLPAVPEVLGWLNWPASGHQRTLWLGDVLLRRDEGHREVPAAG